MYIIKLNWYNIIQLMKYILMHFLILNVSSHTAWIDFSVTWSEIECNIWKDQNHSPTIAFVCVSSNFTDERPPPENPKNTCACRRANARTRSTARALCGGGGGGVVVARVCSTHHVAQKHNKEEEKTQTHSAVHTRCVNDLSMCFAHRIRALAGDTCRWSLHGCVCVCVQNVEVEIDARTHMGWVCVQFHCTSTVSARWY